MKHSLSADNILSQISPTTRLGDLRKLAKEIKKDHNLAMELWSMTGFLPRQLAILIMDHHQISSNFMDQLEQDMRKHPIDERNQLMDWLLANQLTKSKNCQTLIQSWENSPAALQRRTYWYYQARLRWMGHVTDLKNTDRLLTAIESRILDEEPEVQWAMNFTAGWIGVYEGKYRARCIAIGERTGLFREQKVSKGCTPDYLPEFIRIESSKRKL